MEPHYQISSSTTPQLSSDTIRASRSLWTSSTESRTSNGNGLSWRPLSTSGNLGLESPIDASMTPTTKSQGISSPVKPPAKSSLTGMTDSTLSGSTSSGEPQCRSHYFSDCVINGIIESRPREGLSLSVICGRCLSPLQHIQIIGGDNVLSIWKTQGNCGEDSLESITYQKLPDTTAIPLSSSIQRPSMTNSLVRMKKRQPQSRSKSKPKDNEQKPWS